MFVLMYIYNIVCINICIYTIIYIYIMCVCLYIYMCVFWKIDIHMYKLSERTMEREKYV